MNDLDYLRLSKPQKLLYNLKKFFVNLPKGLLGALMGLVNWFVKLFKGVGRELYDLVETYIKGDWKTKVSYTVMGFGSAARGQRLRGLLFFAFQTIFNVYMFLMGGRYLSLLTTLGVKETTKVGRKTEYGDNSFLILLYGVLTVFFVLAFIYTWRVNVKQNKISEQILKSGKKLQSAKDDVTSMLDSQFHKTLLAIPTLGVTVFTILPIIFMILVAFTNYDNQHQPPQKLFSWVGAENFATLLTGTESRVDIKVSSVTNGVANLTITAKNGDILTVSCADEEAARAAAALTVLPSASVTPDKAATLPEEGGAPVMESHFFTISASQKDPVNFETYSYLADEGVTLQSMFAGVGDGKLTVSMVKDGDKNAVMTITGADGKRIIMETSNMIAADRFLDRAGASKPVLTLKDDIDAIFALTELPHAEGEPAEYTMEVNSLKGDPVVMTVGSLRTVDTPSYAHTFKQVLLWTLLWAFFATFLNYFLGMLVAIMINKKGIRFKKLWRTVLVMTIAIPQFISLLYVSKMFAADGLINGLLQSWGWIKEPLPFWTDPIWAKVTIIGINVWIGIPYLMLIATGILMNIPADLYESARIDGANAFQTYMKITLPYMLFVTGPYLLTSFTGNINNFNVIFLLSGGKPLGMDLAGNAGHTDLLITWLYKMTVTDSNYKLAAVMGILVFVVCAVINLIVYNLIPSVKNEEDFQ